MDDEFPGYEWLGTVGPNLPDEEGGDFYQEPLWLHRPCGIVVADRQAHENWHAGLVQEIRTGIREAQHRGGWSKENQIR